MMFCSLRPNHVFEYFAQLKFTYKNLQFHSTILWRLHDDSANDDSAIDKMAVRFWHTDDSATFLFEKKAKIFFLPLTGFT